MRTVSGGATVTLAIVLLLLCAGLSGSVAGRGSAAAIPSQADCDGDRTASWPMHGYDAENTGWNPAISGPAERVTKTWNVTTGNWTRSAVAVHDGTAYVTVTGDTLRAVDARSGRTRWTYAGDGREKTDPVVAHGLVYVGTERSGGGLTALSPSDGSIQWRAGLEGNRGVSAITTADGDAVYVRAGETVVSVAAADGTVQWRTRVGLNPGEQPAVHDGVVYTVGGNRLHAVDADTGDVDWTYADKAVGSAPTVGDSRVFFSTGGEDSEVVALDANGDELWATETSGWSVAPPTYADGTVFVGGIGTVHAFDADSGDTVWEYTGASGWLLNQIVASSDTLYVASEGGTIDAVDLESGDERWSVSLSPSQAEQIESPPSVTNRSIYVTSIDWAENATGEIEVTPAARIGHVYRLSTCAPVSVRTSTPGTTAPSTDGPPSTAMATGTAGSPSGTTPSLSGTTASHSGTAASSRGAGNHTSVRTAATTANGTERPGERDAVESQPTTATSGPGFRVVATVLSVVLFGSWRAWRTAAGRMRSG